MTKKIKKGTKGASSKFISRAKAIKKLDISIKDFRKLCILKGVYPREPTKKLSNNHKTYYHAKDIAFLANDKLMDFFKNQNIYKKKLQKAIARRDKTRVKALKENKPVMDLAHIVRERYPNFNEALKDIEDPLTLLSLIAKFPGHRLFKVAPEKVELSKILLLMLKALIVKEKLLNKVFLSVKGIYYQIEVNGHKITWLEPYPFVTTLPFDVDYKIMLSFTEFYQVLTKFVTFKLYKERNVVYPPTLVPWEDLETSLPEGTTTFQNICLQDSERHGDEDEQKIEEEFQNQQEVRKIMQKEKKASKKLFEGLVFFLSREVQKDLFELCTKAFSGIVIYDGENFNSEVYKSTEITHVISDRNSEHIPFLPNREYVQPQWICDSINFGLLLPVADYKPGKALPPHLSPFISDEKEGYVPERKKEILKLQGEYVEESLDESEVEDQDEEEVVPKAAEKPKYKVQDEQFDIEKQQLEEKKKAFKKGKDTEELQALMLTKKRQRLLDKIKNFDDKKMEKVKKIIERKKQLKKQNQ